MNLNNSVGMDLIECDEGDLWGWGKDTGFGFIEFGVSLKHSSEGVGLLVVILEYSPEEMFSFKKDFGTCQCQGIFKAIGIVLILLRGREREK